MLACDVLAHISGHRQVAGPVDAKMEDGQRPPPPPPPLRPEVPPPPPRVPRQHLARVALDQARDLFRAKAQGVPGVPPLPQFQQQQQQRNLEQWASQQQDALWSAPRSAPQQRVPQQRAPQQSAPPSAPQQSAPQQSAPQPSSPQSSPQQSAPQQYVQQRTPGPQQSAAQQSAPQQSAPQQSAPSAGGAHVLQASQSVGATPVGLASGGELTGIWRVGSPAAAQSPPLKKRKEDGSEVPQKARPFRAAAVAETPGPRITMGSDGKPRLMPTPKISSADKARATQQGAPDEANVVPPSSGNVDTSGGCGQAQKMVDERTMSSGSAGDGDRQAALEKENADLARELARATRFLEQYEQGKQATLQGTPPARPCASGPPQPSSPPTLAPTGYPTPMSPLHPMSPLLPSPTMPPAMVPQAMVPPATVLPARVPPTMVPPGMVPQAPPAMVPPSMVPQAMVPPSMVPPSMVPPSMVPPSMMPPAMVPGLFSPTRMDQAFMDTQVMGTPRQRGAFPEPGPGSGIPPQALAIDRAMNNIYDSMLTLAGLDKWSDLPKEFHVLAHGLLEQSLEARRAKAGTMQRGGKRR